MLIKFAHFFLSEWLWSMSWGAQHVTFNIVIGIILLKLFLRINMVPCVFMTIISQIVAFLGLSALAFISMLFIGVGGGPESFAYVPRPLFAAVFLGLVYAIFQIFFFITLRKRYQLPLGGISVILLISNNLATLITWLLLSIE